MAARRAAAGEGSEEGSKYLVEGLAASRCVLRSRLLRLARLPLEEEEEEEEDELLCAPMPSPRERSPGAPRLADAACAGVPAELAGDVPNSSTAALKALPPEGRTSRLRSELLRSD